MHRTPFKTFLYIGITSCLLSMQSCKLDPPVYPNSLSDTSGLPAVDVLKKPHLFVFTSAKGLNVLPHPSRICTTTDGTKYITSAAEGKVFKLDALGRITILLNDVKKPTGIKLDQEGNVYVMLTGENKIAKISPGGKVSTVKINAYTNSAQDLAIASDGTLYIADTGNSRILKVSQDGTVVPLAGKIATFGLKDGTGENAHFSYPTNIRLASDGFLWVIDGDGSNNNWGQTIRRISKKGQVSTYFTQQNKALSITDVAVAKLDKELNPSPVINLFLTYNNNTVAHFATDGQQTLLAKITTPGHTDGDIITAQFHGPSGVCVNGTSVYIADEENNSVRKIAAVKPN
jgi:hypothetical protein